MPVLFPSLPPSLLLTLAAAAQGWTGEPSTKERFALDAQAVPRLLLGVCDVDTQLSLHVARGTIREADASKAAALGREVQEAITRQKLAPVMRSVYRRCAFQHASDNAVRVTLDTNLKLLQERRAHRIEALGW